MVKIPLQVYAKMIGKSRQTVDTMINDGKLKAERGGHGKTTYIIIEELNPEDINLKVDSSSQQPPLSKIDKTFSAFIVELKDQQREQLEKMDYIHNETIKTIKETYDKQLDMIKDNYERVIHLKDEEIERLKKEKPGLFKRLFG